MKKFKSQYPDHPQHGLYEDDPYDDRPRGRNYIVLVIAFVLVAVLIISALAELQG